MNWLENNESVNQKMQQQLIGKMSNTKNEKISLEDENFLIKQFETDWRRECTCDWKIDSEGFQSVI